MWEDQEEDPLDIAEAVNEVDETAKLCLLGKVWTERNYNMSAMMDTMKKLWNPSKGMTCRELGSNLVSFQFNAKRDMERVQSMEPWSFNKHILVLKPLDYDIQPSMMKFDKVPCWIRLYDIPMRGREEAALRMIGQRFGEVIEIDTATVGGISRSVRMKIRLNLENALKRGTKIRVGTSDPCWIPITYERISSFCYWCGKLGHTHKDCESFYERPNADAEITEKNMPYGEWMKASPLKRMQPPPQRTAEEHEYIRRSLFQKEEKDVTKKYEPEARNEDEKKNESQVSELQKSLEKVVMSSISHEENSRGSQITSNTDGNYRLGRTAISNKEIQSAKDESHEDNAKPWRKIEPSHRTVPLSKVITGPNFPLTQKSYTPAKPHNPTLLNQVTNPKALPTLPTFPQNKPVPPKPEKPIPPLIPEKPELGDGPNTISEPAVIPIETLRKMVASNLLYPAYTPNSTPRDTPQQHPKPPIRIKTEPLSPKKPKQKTWRRQDPKEGRLQGSHLVSQGKRKEDYMEIDSGSEKISKKQKNNGMDHTTSTAEAAEQSRRSS